MTALVIVEAVVIAVLAVLVVGLLRSHADILRALHDLGVNLDDEHDDGTFKARRVSVSRDEPDVDLRSARLEPTPASTTPPPGLVEARRPTNDPATLGAATDIGGVTPDGEAAVVAVVDAPQPTLLAFLSSGCATCIDFWDAFAAEVALDLDGRAVRIVAVTKGPADESPGAVERLAGPSFTTVMSTEAYDDYGVPVSPYFVLVDAHGAEIVGEGAATSWPQLASLLDRAVADRSGGAGSLGAHRTRRELIGRSAITRSGTDDLS